jgi:uncharacterized membrane protein YdbT with pleckstrin-like domain
MPDIFDSSQHKTSKENKKTENKKTEPRVNGYSKTLKKEPSATNPLAAFAAKPRKTRFDSQMEDEEIVLMLRRHPVTQVKKLLVALTASFLPILFFSTPVFGFMPPRFKLATGVGWYMLLLTFIIESFLTWFFNVFIITDERIIDVDFLSLIHKNVSSAKIENIEDVTVETGGVLASLVDFGYLKIQTSAEVPEIQFENIPRPSTVARVLNELILEEEQEKLEGRVR